MEINLIDIKQAFILNFDGQKFGNDGSTYYHASRTIEPIVGLLEDEYFLDIETYRLYPIMFTDLEQVLLDYPINEIEYAYYIESYEPKNIKQKIEILEKARRAHEWYSFIKNGEKKENLVSFEKKKYKMMLKNGINM